MGIALAGAVGATMADSAGQPFAPQRPPVAILNDPGFASHASAVCEASLDLVSPLGRSAPPDLRTLVAHLRALPVQVSDRPAVNGWLANWDAAAGLLHGTAARPPGTAARPPGTAARPPGTAGRPTGTTSRRQGAELDSSLQGIDDFARVNGISGCVL